MKVSKYKYSSIDDADVEYHVILVPREIHEHWLPPYYKYNPSGMLPFLR